MRTLRKAVFFDRDGTLIVDQDYLNDPGKIVYLPGVFEALQRLRDAGFVFVVATNQSGMAKGIVSIENLDLIHQKMTDEFARHGIHFAGFYYAPQSSGFGHPMQKPNPGMLETAALDHGIDLKQSWMIGDRERDVEAGRRAGTRTILLEGTKEAAMYAPATATVSNLKQVADFILRNDP